MLETTIQEPRRPHITIQPTSGWQMVNLREIWHFRDLLITMADRDLKLRYRQTALGAVWIILGPLLSAGLFSFVFGRVAHLPSEGVAYFPFVFAGQLGWNAFQSTLSKAQGSLLVNKQLVSKIYFPRLILPLSGVYSTMVDFGVMSILMAILMAIYGIKPHAGLILMPVWLLLMQMLALGIGLYTGAASVAYRDAGSFVGPLTQLLQWGSPIAYAVAAVPPSSRPFYYLNPLASLVQAFRWSLLGTSAPPWPYVAYSAIVATVVLAVGAFYFRKAERGFADVI